MLLASEGNDIVCTIRVYCTCVVLLDLHFEYIATLNLKYTHY